MTESKVVDVLSAYIRTRDNRLAKDRPWSPTPLRDYFLEMLTRGSVRVGGRSSCGAGTDPTLQVLGYWNEVVDKARKLGIQITEESIKQRNAWATRARGFWNESEYSTPKNDSLREALELPRNPRQLETAVNHQLTTHAALAACTPAKEEGR